VTCIIRAAEPRDATALAELAARTFSDTYAEQNDPAHMAAHRARAFSPAIQAAEIADPAMRTLLAIEGDAMVGFAQVRRKDPPACVREPAAVELARIYVDRGAHGRGVAQALMGAARAAAVALGGRHLWLGVWERNPRAIAFYRKMEFRDVGATHFYVGPDRQDDRVFVLALGAEEADATRGPGDRPDPA